ncbi:MAG: acylglycerol kinase family protein, partial [Acidobacteriota bacterium]
MLIVAIINPISGPGADPASAARRVALVRAEAGRRGLRPDIYLTERAGHARELAASSAAAGADLVIVWGGDGTLNEAGAGLLGSTTAIGLVP